MSASPLDISPLTQSSEADMNLHHRAAATTGDRHPASETLLRMEYSMAVMRLVNGVTDGGQRGKFALSVAGLASSAGKSHLFLLLHQTPT